MLSLATPWSCALWWHGAKKYPGLVTKNQKRRCPLPRADLDFTLMLRASVCDALHVGKVGGKWHPRNIPISPAKGFDLVSPQKKTLKRFLHPGSESRQIHDMSCLEAVKRIPSLVLCKASWGWVLFAFFKFRFRFTWWRITSVPWL